MFSEVLSFIKRFPYLEVWSIHQEFDLADVTKLATTLPRLHTINMREANPTTKQVNELLAQLPIKRIILQQFVLIDFSNLTVFETYSPIPLIHSESLKRIQGTSTPSLQDLVDACPNVVELHFGELQLTAPLVSSKIRKVLIGGVWIEKAFDSCPLLEKLHIYQQWDNKKLSSSSVTTLCLENDSAFGDIELGHFPNLKNLEIWTRLDSMDSESLETLIIHIGDFPSSFHLPCLRNLKLGDELYDHYEYPEILQLPATIEHLEINIPESEWLGPLLPQLSSLLTLQYCGDLNIFSSPTMTVLKFDGFFCREDLEKTLFECPRLRCVYLCGNIVNPWVLNRANTDIPSEVIWREFQAIEVQATFLVPLSYAGKMPRSFNELLQLKRVGYY
eukprot:CFRG3240T1